MGYKTWVLSSSLRSRGVLCWSFVYGRGRCSAPPVLRVPHNLGTLGLLLAPFVASPRRRPSAECKLGRAQTKGEKGEGIPRIVRESVTIASMKHRAPRYYAAPMLYRQIEHHCAAFATDWNLLQNNFFSPPKAYNRSESAYKRVVERCEWLRSLCTARRSPVFARARTA